MCGIAGIIGKNASKDVLLKMTNAQKHRGPDYTGFWLDENVCFGHNRLSIIDLSENANQPFQDEEERYQLIFNGEIYNYLELKNELDYNFVTSSDTEVLFAAYLKWGKACLNKLNGMFSFAVWDSVDKKLFAARDRFGVKPFYYHFSNNTLYFASEIKAIHAVGIEKKPNERIWVNYFCYGSYGMPNECFWEDISQLAGGYFLEFEKNEITVQRWYIFEEEIKKHQQNLSYNEVKEHYVSLMKDSIALRFRSDVNIGFNVSGGLDSSGLLAFVNQQEAREKINAFSFYTNDERYDEIPWVEEMIALTDNPLEKVLLEAKEVKDLALKIQKHQDEPYGGIPTLAYSKIFEKARAKNTLVLLDGQGMDEQWAGYDYYIQKNEATIQGVKKSPFKKEVLSKEMIALSQKPIYPKPFKEELLNKQYRDLFYTKIPRALRFNDRISMAFGTELREPFLDHRLVEFAFAQPLEYKIKEGVQKRILRDIVSEYLSDSISYAPKRPLQTPQREWLSHELAGFVSEELKALETSKFASWFNFEILKQEWKQYLDGDNNSSFHIWQLLSVALSLKENA